MTDPGGLRTELAADLGVTLRGLRRTAPAAAAAVVSLGLGAAVALAVFGLYDVGSLVPFNLRPRLALDPLPAPSWDMQWSPVVRLPAALRGDGLAALLQLGAAFGACVLAIGVVGAGIVQLGRASARRFEIALHATVGAPRGRLARQLAVEGVLLAAVTSAAALLLGTLGARVLTGTWPHGVMAGALDPRVPALLLAPVAAAAFVSSLAPRMRMARRGWIGDAVAPEARTNPGAGAADVRRLLVVAQFAAALVLAGTAGLLLRHATPTVDPARTAYDPAGRFAVSLDASALDAQGRSGAFAALRERLSAVAGVEATGIASAGAAVGAGTMDRALAGCPWCTLGGLSLPAVPVYAQVHVAGAGFFDTLGVAVVRGRSFEQNGDASDVVVVNEAFAARGFQGGEPVGRRIQLGGFAGTWFTIVGVVRDIPRVGVGTDELPAAGPAAAGFAGHVAAVYLPAASHAPARAELVLRSPVPAGELEGAVRPVLAGLGIGAGTIESMVTRLDHERAPLAWFGGTMLALAAVVLALAVHGLHALMRFFVSLRRTEIGVRRAVGARRAAIERQFLGEALALAACGAVPGLIGAVTTARVIGPLFPGLPAFDGAVFLGCAAVLAAATLLGAWLPARRAARLDPADALRGE